jgi:hypothetical protein
MQKKYSPKKDISFGLLFLVCPLMLWFIFILHPNIYFFLFALVITLFFLWIWFGTFYQLDNEYFMYRSGPLKKKIPINKIVKIKQKVRSFYGMRPALAFQYMQIRYDAYDDVFIAPKDEATFLADIIDLNPNISIEKA